ncbi:sorting nexin lst-4 [Bactrocera neohumeralis]|uniref:sorting nexin lst-4 n=1 Tax=Bactrocera neohumeralis TaxID=98809 RepID=UPI0021652E2A|nr:sorting nexin lst-4 [Bactrocera neohumeralis]
MTSYVRAMYDFSGEPGSSEISIKVGEILAVTRTDVGEGWWEGKNSQGKVGLFPAAYVEVMSAAEAQKHNQHASASSPVALPAATTTDPSNRYDQTADEYDDWEDDWDDDNETYSEIGPSGGTKTSNHTGLANQLTHSASNYDNKNLPAAPMDDTISLASIAAPNNTATLKKSGMFGKSSDSYILGLGNKEKLSEHEIVHIAYVESFCYWQTNHQRYTVIVASPKKESKFKGMKTFIAYQLTPSFNNISVSRRYKHFDWLHERLVEKFCLIPIPPLPDKQISGRYEEQFVEHRRVQLQEFVDWVCRHPVLSQCEVWHHFLTCNDDKMWKSGKRKAERDTYVGVSYCWAISPPEKTLLPSLVDAQIESCLQFTHAMDISVRNLLALSNDTAKRYQTQCKKEFQRIGDGMSDLAKALNIDERRAPSKTTPLSESVGRVGGIFIGIGQLFGDQPKLDWIPLSDRLHIYRGVLNSFPDILSTHKGAMQKRKECERLTSEQKMSNAQMTDVNRRTDVISYAVMAEMSHFKEERDTHMKQALKSFIEEQIKFYSNVVNRLQEAYRQFE